MPSESRTARSAALEMSLFEGMSLLTSMSPSKFAVGSEFSVECAVEGSVDFEACVVGVVEALRPVEVDVFAFEVVAITDTKIEDR